MYCMLCNFSCVDNEASFPELHKVLIKQASQNKLAGSVKDDPHKTILGRISQVL